MKKIALITLFLSCLTYAQEQTSSKIKVYTPSSTKSVANNSNTYKWAVKTDFASFAVGEFPIIGEYRVTNKLSVEASAGVTYAFIPNDIFAKDLISNSTSFETKATMGSAFRGGIKFYPSSDYDALEGWSFGIQAFYKTNNREYEPNSNYNLAGLKDSKVKTGIEITIAKQIYQDSNICFESLVGIGIANINYDFYTRENSYSNGVYTDVVSKQSYTEKVPNFHLGLRMGFGN